VPSDNASSPDGVFYRLPNGFSERQHITEQNWKGCQHQATAGVQRQSTGRFLQAVVVTFHYRIPAAIRLGRVGRVGPPSGGLERTPEVGIQVTPDDET
jgi:hypothetical protein